MTLQNCKEILDKNTETLIILTNLQRIAFRNPVVKSISYCNRNRSKFFIVNCEFFRWVGFRSMAASFIRITRRTLVSDSVDPEIYLFFLY